MTTEQAIYQLTDLIKDRESFCHRDDFDDMFLQDIEALKIGISALEKQVPKKVVWNGLAVRIADTIISMWKKRNLIFVLIAVRLWIGVMKMSEIQVEINGVSHTFKEWAEISGINVGTIKDRYYHFKNGTDLIAPVRKRVLLITINEETHTLKEWATITGLLENTLRTRYYLGKRGKSLIEPRKCKKRFITINGETHTFREWADITGIDEDLLKCRYHLHKKRGEDLIKPLRRRKK